MMTEDQYLNYQTDIARSYFLANRDRVGEISIVVDIYPHLDTPYHIRLFGVESKMETFEKLKTALEAVAYIRGIVAFMEVYMGEMRAKGGT